MSLIQDDIGDKSVFMFNALPEEEKQALIEKLELQKNEWKLFTWKLSQTGKIKLLKTVYIGEQVNIVKFVFAYMLL